jgi:alpha-beta hydrolase superfamily lysophospholipase
MILINAPRKSPLVIWTLSAINVLIASCNQTALAQASPQQRHDVLQAIKASQAPVADNKYISTQLKALDLAAEGKLTEAHQTLIKIVPSSNEIKKIVAQKNASRDVISVLYFAALIERYTDQFKLSIQHLEDIDTLYQNCTLLRGSFVQTRPDLPLLDQALKRTESPEPILAKDQAATTWERVQLMERMGDVYRRFHKNQLALQQYKSALFVAERDGTVSGVVRDLMEKISGVLTEQKDFAEAEQYARRLVDATMITADESDFRKINDHLWAHFALADILRYQGKETALQKIENEDESIISRAMAARSKMEKLNHLPNLEEIKNFYLLKQFAKHPPTCLGDMVWEIKEFKLKSLPVISWLPPEGKKIKAIIICIHGLGLDNRSFTAFGRQFADRGYFVIALDVRGFGAWLSVPGKEEAAYDATIHDIKRVAQIVGKSNPGIPRFILGESMGGAIALQAAARIPDTFAGVISSVPSAKRYQQRSMTFTTARHFLRDPNMPFNIGEQIAKQATSDQAAREAWENDPKAKFYLTPKELMHFDKFMKRTTEFSSTIKTTPSLVIQGLKDRLVQPEGTFKIFESIPCDNKTLMIVGEFEHLIFENEEPSSVLMDTVSSWIDRMGDLAK